MKKLILSFLLILTLTISFVSAGLCRGNDGYYHDCDDSRYFEAYDDEYYYNGRYYPSRAYYYRDYYKPRYRRSSSKIEQYYKDVEEYTRTIEYRYKDRYGYENIKTSILEKTEIESDYEIPYYVSGRRSRNYMDNRYWYESEDNEEDEQIIIKSIPWHYSQYKGSY